MNEMIVSTPQRQIADVTRDIRRRTGQFLLEAIEIGRLLFEAKSMVEPGGWMQYVADELPFSQSWANNYMKLYKEYGGEQLSIFGNSQATAKLSPTQALDLLALPAQEREEFLETHDVENMSTRELKQAIRERDEAIQSQKETEEDLLAAETRANDHADRADKAEAEVERLRSELAQAEDAGTAAAEKVEKLNKQLAKAKEAKKAAEDALAKAKENPEVPETVMEQLRQQVAADAAKEATEELQKQLDAANAAKDTADKAKAEAEKKLEDAERAVKLSNPDTAVLQELSNRFLDDFNNMHRRLKMVQQSDPETGEKLKAVIIKTIDQMRNMING